MSKKLLVGLIVAFVVSLALPMVAQAQANCKYVGPADPLALQTVVPAGSFTKTVKAQKEIFYCYDDPKNVPDDKTLQDPLANRDKIAKGLRWIVEMEIFAFIVENTATLPPSVTKRFQVTRCVKERRSSPVAEGTLMDTWMVTRCDVWLDDPATDAIDGDDFELEAPATYMGRVPDIPSTAARGCAPEFYNYLTKKQIKTSQPYLGGPIPVEDPIEMNTVVTATYIKTVKVNKEVFRCFNSGSPDAPVIYDIELYTEELESLTPPFRTVYKAFEVAYCAKKEKEAILLGCSFRGVGDPPWIYTAGGVPAALLPFTTLTSAGVRPSAGQYVFEAQGYNIEGVQVQVYNLSGKQVFSAETSGTQLSWNGLSSDGRPLANGVYLYVMTVKGTYGDVVQTKVQKLAILR